MGDDPTTIYAIPASPQKGTMAGPLPVEAQLLKWEESHTALPRGTERKSRNKLHGHQCFVESDIFWDLLNQLDKGLSDTHFAE